MQVSIEKEGLEHRMKVTVPASEVEEQVQSRLNDLSKRVRMDGFRPGKVPLRVVERRYGPQVRQEVQGEVIQRTFYQALSDENLRPAGNPSFEPQSLAPGEDLTYIATFEVYPELDIQVPETLQVEKPVAEVGEQDIDKMIERLREQRMEWQPVERAAQDGDRLTINFKGTVEGEPFPGGEAEDYPLVIGAGRLIGDFEHQLVGAQAGESRAIEVTFPSDYQAQDLAGKTAWFQVEVLSVAEPKRPEVDEDLARAFGIEDGSVAAFRERVRESMQQELDQAVRDRVKSQVMDVLWEANPMELPRALIDEEIERLRQQMPDMQNIQDEATRQAVNQGLEERARRRVALGLIVAELIKRHGFQVEPDKVRAAVERIAASYDNPQEVVQWYYSDKERLGGVEALLLEDKAVDWVLEQAEVTEKPSSYDEIFARQ